MITSAQYGEMRGATAQSKQSRKKEKQAFPGDSDAAGMDGEISPDDVCDSVHKQSSFFYTILIYPAHCRNASGQASFFLRNVILYLK